MRWSELVTRIGDPRCTFRVAVGRPEGKRPPGRPRHRWENNIEMDLYDVELGRGLY